MGCMDKENMDFIVYLLSFIMKYVIKILFCCFFKLIYDLIDVFFIISIIIMNIKSYF